MQAFNTPPESLPSAYLGNLHPQTVQGDFDDASRGLFRELKVHNIHLVRDRETDEPKGFGYATFKDQESLDKALNLNGSIVNGQPINIALKKTNANRRGGGSIGGGRGGRMDYGNGRDFGGNRGGQDRNRGGPAGGDNTKSVPDEPPFTAFIGNLPEVATESDLELMFQGLDVKTVRLVIDRQTGNHKGHGYAEFNNKESLVKALTLNNAEWMKKFLQVSVHVPKPKFGEKGGFGSSFNNNNNSSGGRFPRGPGDQPFGRGPRPTQTKPADDIPETIDDTDRPKLVLQKKSDSGSNKSLTQASSSSASKPNPFGNAKPVDTASRLKQLDEAKKKSEPSEISESKPTEAKPTTAQ